MEKTLKGFDNREKIGFNIDSMVKQKQQQHGWVIRNKETGDFVNRNPSYNWTKKIKNSRIFQSREHARICKNLDETVYKVGIDSKGIAETIISGDFGSRFGSLD